jgi:small-conductance mechanosensitive channel
MPQFRLLVLLALLAFAPVAPFSQALAQDGTISTDTGAAQTEKDAAMAVKIRELIGELDGFEDVTVTVAEGIVTLRGTTLEVDGYDKLDALVGRVDGVVAIENNVTASTDVVERINPALERFWTRIKQAFAYIPLLVVALVAFAAMVALGYLIARLRQPWDRIAPNAFIADIFRVVIRLAFMVFGVVVALDILGATALLSTILGAAGLVGLAIGFAVRDTVENFIASVLLSIRQPFRPNDAVEIGGDEGKVIRLTSRATILLSWDGNHIRIPNATVFKSRIVNYSRNPERRFKIDIGVGYGTDLAEARALAQEVLEGLPFVLDAPAVNIWTTELGGSEVGMKLTAWIDQRETSLSAARSEAIRQVLIAFDKAGIEMPEPTYRVLMPKDNTTTGSTGGQARSQQVQNVDASAERELESIVDAERECTDDLLTKNALEE